MVPQGGHEDNVNACFALKCKEASLAAGAYGRAGRFGGWRRWSGLRAERGAHSPTMPFPGVSGDMSEPSTGGFDAARTHDHHMFS